MTNQDGRLCDRRTKADDRQIRHVVVSGVEARRAAPNFVEWETVLDDWGARSVDRDRFGTDFAGNVEERPHVVRVL
jgi:hypothetical protein